MRRKLLIMALTTAMVATLLTGCGEKDDTKDSSTTTPVTKVEQSDNNDANTPTSKEEDKEEEPASKEEVKGYDEKFYDEPNWEEEYNEDIASGWSEKDAQMFKEKNILEYEAMKFVFEDMTQNFKHKKEVTAIEGIDVVFSPENTSKTFVCDVKNAMPENAMNREGEPIIFNRELYKEFCGFNAKKTEVTSWVDSPDIKVSLEAFYVDGQTPLYVNVTLNRNEDGTFVYKEITIGSNIYE